MGHDYIDKKGKKWKISGDGRNVYKGKAKYFCHDCGRYLSGYEYMTHNADHWITDYSIKYDYVSPHYGRNYNKTIVRGGKKNMGYNFKNQMRRYVPRSQWANYYKRGWRAGRKFNNKAGRPVRYFYKNRR